MDADGHGWEPEFNRKERKERKGGARPCHAVLTLNHQLSTLNLLRVTCHLPPVTPAVFPNPVTCHLPPACRVEAWRRPVTCHPSASAALTHALDRRKIPPCQPGLQREKILCGASRVRRPLSIEASAKLDVHRPVHRSHTTWDEGGSLGGVGSLLRGWQNGKSGFNASRSRFGLRHSAGADVTWVMYEQAKMSFF